MGHEIGSVLLPLLLLLARLGHLKASFVVRGDHGPHGGNPGLHSASLGRFMNAAQAEARSRAHTHASGTSTRRKAWSLGFEGRRRRGPNGRGRTGKERVAHTRHDVGGKQKNTRQCLIPTIIYSPAFPSVCVRAAFTGLSATSSPR